MTETPIANRIRIAFFGLRNAGKSTLVNEFCGQPVAIVSPVAGTTTDPVSKAMEILPLGPCLVTDTAGLDDEGELGRQRVGKTLAVLESADIAIWVAGEGDAEELWKERVRAECRARAVEFIEYRRGEPVAGLRTRVAAVKTVADPRLLEGLVGEGDRVILVAPIDESAPKGRLILPQVQVLRECLDRHALATVCQVAELESALAAVKSGLVITDSQAFAEVSSLVAAAGTAGRPPELTSFSILFARQKGDLEEFRRGVEAAKGLKDGDRVLVAEACTHHRQCNDIGTVKIPKAVARLSGARPEFKFVSGNDFPAELSGYALVIHCGGCMITRRTMLSRIARCRAAGTPIANYGLILQEAALLGAAAKP